MPEISRFYGIVIYMFSKDHNPPHFHVKHGEYMATIDIRTGEVIKGTLKRRSLRLVQDWVELHQNELIYNWKQGIKDNPNFNKIDPLE